MSSAGTYKYSNSPAFINAIAQKSHKEITAGTVLVILVARYGNIFFVYKRCLKIVNWIHAYR